MINVIMYSFTDHLKVECIETILQARQETNNDNEQLTCKM